MMIIIFIMLEEKKLVKINGLSVYPEEIEKNKKILAIIIL